MTVSIDIEKRRGDTRRIVFTIKDPETDEPSNISAWTGFKLTVDPYDTPLTTDNNIGQITGSLTGDGTDGRVGFIPPGNWNAGNYYYDAQAIDHNGEKVTFVAGKYTIVQDITKD